jgi:hypothetical protein
LKAPSDLLFPDFVQFLPQFILNFNIPLYSIPETGRNCKIKSRRRLPLLARICTKQFGSTFGCHSAEGSHILQQSGPRVEHSVALYPGAQSRGGRPSDCGPRQVKFQKNKFCKHGGIERLTGFTVQSKSTDV